MIYLRKCFKRSRWLVLVLSLSLLFGGCSMGNPSSSVSEGIDDNTNEDAGNDTNDGASDISSEATSVDNDDTTTDSTTDSTTDTTTDSLVDDTDVDIIVTKDLSYNIEDVTGSVVFMTSDINPEGLMSIYEALDRQPTGNVAVKISTGEPGGNNYLSPDLIKCLVQKVDATIVECNTAYGGGRMNTALHRQVAEDHGFTAIAEVDIMDADGSISIPIEGGTNLTEDRVGSHFTNYDFYIILSHFKGHAMGGFGGAIKNMSIGIASSEGKSWIHSSGTSTSGLYGDHDNFLESMAEAAKGVSDYLNKGENILYISVMNKLSVDCDCDNSPAEPDMHDIGILASLDPVALDQACVDLVYAAPDGASLIKRMEDLNGIHTLEHADEIGFGSRTYTLVNIDD